MGHKQVLGRRCRGRAAGETDKVGLSENSGRAARRGGAGALILTYGTLRVEKGNSTSAKAAPRSPCVGHVHCAVCPHLSPGAWTPRTSQGPFPCAWLAPGPG